MDSSQASGGGGTVQIKRGHIDRMQSVNSYWSVTREVEKLRQNMQKRLQQSSKVVLCSLNLEM